MNAMFGTEIHRRLAGLNRAFSAYGCEARVVPWAMSALLAMPPVELMLRLRRENEEDIVGEPNGLFHSSLGRRPRYVGMHGFSAEGANQSCRVESRLQRLGPNLVGFPGALPQASVEERLWRRFDGRPWWGRRASKFSLDFVS